jgi:peptidylprolyl isomerase/peptidyl-prolyl cis-trans isomerase B (cyclophilin B)
VLDSHTIYGAKVVTTAGTFSVILYTGITATVTNDFVYLARHRAFDCLAFAQAAPPGVIEVGGQGAASPSTPGSSTSIPIGSLVTTLGGQSVTGASQWFLVSGIQGTTEPAGDVAFGRITAGLNVVQKIDAQAAASGGATHVIHRILSVTISYATGPT